MNLVKNRALVVDDDILWRNLLKKPFGNLNLKVSLAEDLKKVKRLIQKYNFEVAVIDIFLKDEDYKGESTQIFDILNNRHSDCIIFAISGEPKPLPAHIIINLLSIYGIVNYFYKKTFNMETFCEEIRKSLEQKNKPKSLIDISHELQNIKTELNYLHEFFNLFPDDEKQLMESALTTLQKHDISENFLKEKIELCLPIIPFFINWKAEFDLNMIGSKTSQYIGKLSLKSCERVISSWQSIKNHQIFNNLKS